MLPARKLAALLEQWRQPAVSTLNRLIHSNVQSVFIWKAPPPLARQWSVRAVVSTHVRRCRQRERCEQVRAMPMYIRAHVNMCNDGMQQSSSSNFIPVFSKARPHLNALYGIQPECGADGMIEYLELHYCSLASDGSFSSVARSVSFLLFLVFVYFDLRGLRRFGCRRRCL